MYGSMNNAAKAYAQVGAETGVAAASPHQLIVMLYEGLERWLTVARFAIMQSKIPEKCKAFDKAQAILEELRVSLDKEKGGEIAANLDQLYEYMSMRLLEANLKNSLEALAEVQKLAGEIHGAWKAIGPNAKP